MYSQREYQQVPTFDYSSHFTYNRSGDIDDDRYQPSSSSSSIDNHHFSLTSSSGGLSIDQFLYNVLVTLSYLFVILTFPISSWVCVRKISSLQRCMTHRLGKRLPLKGPGYILKLPFIDHISIVELLEQDFPILGQDEQILTSDGSIIQTRQCYATLQVVDAVLTKTSLNKSVDVNGCLKLRFNNLLRSKHIEDLERKMNYIVHGFEDDTNRFLKKWGYAMKFQQSPTFVIIDRADPMSCIKKQIEKVLSPESASESQNPLENFLRNTASNFASPQTSQASQSNPSPPSSVPELPLTKEELDSGSEILREIIRTYKQYLMFYSELAIEFRVSTTILHYYSYTKEGNSLLKLEFAPLKIDLTIEFVSCENYRQFLRTRDMNLLRYKLGSGT